MSYALAHKLIRGKLLEWWESSYPQLPLYWDNMESDPPADSEWAYATLIPGNSRLAGLGGDPSSRRWRVVGVLVVQVFTPLQEGVSRGEALAAGMATEFQGRTVENVRFLDVSLVRLGQSGAWHQQNISTSYQFDYYG